MFNDQISRRQRLGKSEFNVWEVVWAVLVMGLMIISAGVIGIN